MRSEYLKFTTIISLIFIIDIYTKNLALENLLLNSPLEINNFFNLTLVFNHGAAFSILSEAGGWQKWLFIIMSIIIVSILVILLKIDNDENKIALSLIIGGALGNLFDRITYGYVIDFLEFHYQNFYWTIFNFADITISIGIIMLIYSLFCKK
ncbi:MAG: signal peptidase II [Pseudomonadota bacterium]|nr:signal peptidase II [Pseudomonadota bacterium]